MKHSKLVALVATLVTYPVAGFAQEPIATEEMEKKALEERKEEDGWSAKLKVGASASFNHSHQVVGAQEGATFQVGLVLNGKLDYRSGQHLVENELNIQEAQTKTPQIDSFVKSVDLLDAKSTYSYRFLDPSWVGLFGRATLSTQILPGDAVRVVGGAQTDADGNVIAGTEFAAQERVRLTGIFEPVALRQTLGVFANPSDTKDLTIKVRLGAGAQEIIARDGLVIVEETTDATTQELRLQTKMLESSFSLGAELGLDANGLIVADVLSWKASATLFQPFFTTADITGVEALSTELEAGLSVKLAKWASLDYVVTARRQPLVVQQWQVQNTLLLTAGFDVL
ncbi:MAG: hypothetical protein RMA76_38025 [Deltaproteobacteria bacterium]|jgi:hypothetical protein